MTEPAYPSWTPGARLRRVVIESPFAGRDATERDRHVHYARQCVRHSLSLGEAPIASHLLHTRRGILRDDVPEERRQGIAAGHAWIKVADAVVLYVDLGISRGMAQGALHAWSFAASGVALEVRRIYPPTCHRSERCPVCGGPGHVPAPKGDEPCDFCGGSGFV